MTQQEAESIFTLAGIKVLDIRPLPDGYDYPVSDPRYFEKPPRQVWWFVKTKAGWIEIGWRKRVISINWKDTYIRQILSSDDVTKDETYIHAWTIAKAIEYLTALKPYIV